jgi:hypothetical protein
MILLLMVFNLMVLIRRDIEGVAARQPSGFPGVIGSFISVAIVGLVYYFAGTFREILP